MWFDLVVPVDVFGDCGDLGSTYHLVFEYAVEPFQFPVGLGIVDRQRMLGHIIARYCSNWLTPSPSIRPRWRRIVSLDR